MDISVCVLLSQRVENTQTAFVTTQDITATGKDRNLCAVLCHTIISIKFVPPGFKGQLRYVFKMVSLAVSWLTSWKS